MRLPPKIAGPLESLSSVVRSQLNRHSLWRSLLGLAFLFVLVPQVQALTPLERDLKKIEKYFDDNFCEDAFKLAKDLKASKEGAESFEVWYAYIRGQYCLHDVGSTMEVISEARQKLKLNAVQESMLTSFVREKVNEKFGEVRFAHSPGKSGQIELTISKVGALKDPTLDPYFEFVRKKVSDGIEPPAKIFLPLGDYEIDQVERSIEDANGINFVIGSEKLSRWKRAQIGDGQAIALGFTSMSGFTAPAYTVDQPGTTEQLLIGEYRLTFSSIPYLEMSSTHSRAAGSVGMMGVRFDARLRPPSPALGGVKTIEGGQLIPSFYSAAVSAMLDLPARFGFNFQAGAGVRAGYTSYVIYPAYLDAPEDDSDQGFLAAIYLPGLTIGPEWKLSAGKSVRSGTSGIQVGFELNGSLMVIAPIAKTGQVKLAGVEDSYEYTLGEDAAVWGPVVSGQLFFRTPFF